MIDFWSIIGHAATDKDNSFRNKIYKYAKTIAPTPDANNKYACRFADQDYDNARQDVQAVIGPVSLMALGEWFVVCKLHSDSLPLLDKVAATALALLGGYTSTDPQFYQALGALILDPAFRDMFNNQKEGAYGFRLTAADRAALAKVAVNGAFQGQAGEFQNRDWTQGGCKDMVIQWAQNPYFHSLERPFAQ